jgi:large subunit ribosomal protein L25
MSNEIKIAAQSRTEFGKGASRRLRREDLVPAVMYGHGSDPVHLTMPGHDTLLALRTANALLSISIDGGEPQLALPRQVQRNPLKGTLTHVDLLVVKRGEKVVVEVPLVIIGEEDLDEGIVMADMMSIELEVEATRIPANIEINVAGWEVGRQLTAGELELPEGAAYTGEDEDLVLSINVVREEVAEPEEGEEGEAAEAGAGASEEDAE